MIFLYCLLCQSITGVELVSFESSGTEYPIHRIEVKADYANAEGYRVEMVMVPSKHQDGYLPIEMYTSVATGRAGLSLSQKLPLQIEGKTHSGNTAELTDLEVQVTPPDAGVYSNDHFLPAKNGPATIQATGKNSKGETVQGSININVGESSKTYRVKTVPRKLRHKQQYEAGYATTGQLSLDSYVWTATIRDQNGNAIDSKQFTFEVPK